MCPTFAAPWRLTGQDPAKPRPDSKSVRHVSVPPSGLPSRVGASSKSVAASVVPRSFVSRPTSVATGFNQEWTVLLVVHGTCSQERRTRASPNNVVQQCCTKECEAKVSHKTLLAITQGIRQTRVSFKSLNWDQLRFDKCQTRHPISRWSVDVSTQFPKTF